jgi:hypothetical protein
MTFNAPPVPSPPTQHSSTRRGGFLGFLTTLPGILTAAAGVISAAGGILYAVNDTGPSVNPAGSTYNITVQGGSVPSGSGQVDTSDLSSGVQASVDDQVSALINDCANGSSDACTTLLDQLAQECFDGYGISCDMLYEVSESGSDYQAYGATCGGRYDWTYADACSQL